MSGRSGVDIGERQMRNGGRFVKPNRIRNGEILGYVRTSRPVLIFNNSEA